MKTATVLCLVVTAAFAAVMPNRYTDRYDNTDLDQILHNKRLLIPFVNCVLEQGKCTAEGKELKSHIKEALETYCEKCTKKQADGTRRVIGHLINNEPQYWGNLTAKYDPARKYVVKYEDELRKVKVSG